MKPRHPQVILYGGGRCLERFGVPFWRTSRAEDVPAIFTRAAGDASVVTPTGVREYSADRLRTIPVYNSATGLFEQALALAPVTVNELLRSEEFNHAAWGKTRATVDLNDATGPDGQTTADKLVEDATPNETHHIAQGFDTDPAANDPAGFAVWARAAERDEIRLILAGLSGAAVADAFFDLTGGTVGTIAAGRAFVEAWPDGWHLCGVVTDDVLTGAGPVTARVRLATTGEDDQYDGDGVSGCHLWGGHAGDHESFGYLATVAAARSQPSETLYVPFPIRPSETSVLLDFRWGMDGFVSGATQLFHTGTASATEPSFQILWRPSDVLRVFHDNGTAFVSSDSASVPTPRHGDRFQVLGVLNPDGSVQGAYRQNGGAVVTWGPSAAPAGGLATEWSSPRAYLFHQGGNTSPASLFRVIGSRSVNTLAELDSVLP